MKIMRLTWILHAFLYYGLVPRCETGTGSLDLPHEFLAHYFASYPKLAADCEKDNSCPYKAHLNKNVCWGFEDDCDSSRRYSNPICDEDHKGWVKTKKEQVDTFYKQGDFGYIQNYRDSMKLICKPSFPTDSALECSENIEFCRGRNIMIDFRGLLNRTTAVMYDMDVLKPGEIGGKCELNKGPLTAEVARLSSLQTWLPELRNFVELHESPMVNPQSQCDQIIKTPVYIMKIDATVNMYHHFCDFMNLFASLFVNSTTNNIDMFPTNTKVLIWRTYKYSSSFEATFRAFTSNPIMNLNDFKGKRVCFKNVVFPLLPRMIFGLFYNTPLIWGCRNSGLFNAFSKFVLHRLRVDQRSAPNLNKIRVTLLSRETRYRKILNEDNLLQTLRNNTNLSVRRVAFTWQTDFVEQLSIIAETDILIGMHGAGLTHLLFLPDWAVVFELYNCGDVHCYADLARLRGVKYMTWQDESKVSKEDDGSFKENGNTEHPKHSDYAFDTAEFLKLVNEAVSYVKKSGSKYKRDEL
ncbi:EGF domain-specific O-linked N-acetylglucosamine transferase [Orchesella cincta]|uniref:EGF domain-specific O-linked N-acetylglucosamine transferase n=1 Tax=Orchesella cincta TaxID=48709 RepID=A0A1D2NF40_ORCCI|nr:EGF domain-specific O-linked N-acetylglucosamine transferase [Orchesella cincta]